MCAPSSTIGGATLPWAQNIVWGANIVWGNVLYANQAAWAQNIVWGGAAGCMPVLIGWSASFTYLTMEKFWPLHTRRGGKG